MDVLPVLFFTLLIVLFTAHLVASLPLTEQFQKCRLHTKQVYIIQFNYTWEIIGLCVSAKQNVNSCVDTSQPIRKVVLSAVLILK